MGRGSEPIDSKTQPKMTHIHTCRTSLNSKYHVAARAILSEECFLHLNTVLAFYCLISLTLSVDQCLNMGFLIALRILCSSASPGEL